MLATRGQDLPVCFLQRLVIRTARKTMARQAGPDTGTKH